MLGKFSGRNDDHIETNIALAILSRAVPQLNAMMVSLPISIAVGLVMTGIALPLFASNLETWIQAIPNSVDVMVQAFQPVDPGR